MPLPAPVTIATRPSNEIGVILLSPKRLLGREYCPRAGGWQSGLAPEFAQREGIARRGLLNLDDVALGVVTVERLDMTNIDEIAVIESHAALLEVFDVVFNVGD